MKLLPFDLEKALSGKYKIVTRDNREVDYIHDTGLNINYPIIGHIKEGDFPRNYTKGGKFTVNYESCHDLFLVEEKKKGWVVIYRNEHFGFVSIRCNTIGAKDQVEALHISDGTYLKTVEVEY